MNEPNESLTTYTYDAITGSDAIVRSYTYGCPGTRQNVVEFTSDSRFYAPPGEGLSPNPDSVGATTYCYDAQGLLERAVVLTETGAVTLSYDKVGHVRRYDDGKRIVTYQYGR